MAAFLASDKKYFFLGPVKKCKLAYMTSPQKRWRQTWAAHCRTLAQHGHRFVGCWGGINHYSKMPVELMASTNDLISSLEQYNKSYESWIKSGAVKNHEKFLPKKP